MELDDWLTLSFHEWRLVNQNPALTLPLSKWDAVASLIQPVEWRTPRRCSCMGRCSYWPTVEEERLLSWSLLSIELPLLPQLKRLATSLIVLGW